MKVVYRKKFHLQDDNGGFFTEPTVRVSTVRLPVPHNGGQYETCVFAGDDSDVVERYKTSVEAAAGHAKYCKKYGVKI